MYLSIPSLILTIWTLRVFRIYAEIRKDPFLDAQHYRIANLRPSWLSEPLEGRFYITFFSCSFDQFAKYDLPASLEFAMARSQQRKISYIGHSQGTTIGFAAFSNNQTLAAKINIFIALAPVATVGNMKSPIRYLSYLSGGIQVSVLHTDVKLFPHLYLSYEENQT